MQGQLDLQRQLTEKFLTRGNLAHGQTIKAAKLLAKLDANYRKIQATQNHIKRMCNQLTGFKTLSALALAELRAAAEQQAAITRAPKRAAELKSVVTAIDR